MFVRFGFVAGVLVALTACGSSSVGTWEGDCETNANDQSIDYEMKISVDEEKGGEVTGEAELDGDFDGDLEGEVKGKEIEWTFELSDDYGDYEMILEGEFEDSDTISGDCELEQKSGGDFLAKGEFKIRRD